MSDQRATDVPTYDAAVVGAGFAGLYMLYRLRGLGYRVRVFEAGDGVGGTWYWNRYPGARCDVESVDYSYSFSPELEQEWTWSERYAAQPEILEYLNFVADRFDLRRDIQFETRIASATFDEGLHRWALVTTAGESVTATFCVMATGCLSATKLPEIEGVESFAGPTYHTGRWPHEPVDFSGQRVGMIGTGSSAIQSIPHIASQAERLVVFQRTANFAVPAWNRPLDPDYIAAVKADYPARRELCRQSQAGFPPSPVEGNALEATEGYATIQALVSDYLAQAQRTHRIPAAPLADDWFDDLADSFRYDRERAAALKQDAATDEQLGLTTPVIA